MLHDLNQVGFNLMTAAGGLFPAIFVGIICLGFLIDPAAALVANLFDRSHNSGTDCGDIPPRPLY